MKKLKCIRVPSYPDKKIRFTKGKIYECSEDGEHYYLITELNEKASINKDDFGTNLNFYEDEKYNDFFMILDAD